MAEAWRTISVALEVQTSRLKSGLTDAANLVARFGDTSTKAEKSAAKLGTSADKASTGTTKLGTAATGTKKSTADLGASADKASSSAAKLGSTSSKASGEARKLGTAATGTKKSTADLGASADKASSSAAKLGTSASKASTGTAKLGTAATKSANSATWSSRLWAKAHTEMSAATVALGTAVGLGGAQAVQWLVRMGSEAWKSATQFQVSLKNIESLGEESASSMAHISGAVLDMSKTMPQSAGVLAEGLYDIESSGFSGAEALDVLQAAGVGASAGLTDTATSARVITAVLNSYGMAGSDAEHVSDVLFNTVNVGVVSFEELAQSVGDVIPMAAAMGISLEEATGAVATMTLAGLGAAEASTSSARVMSAFIKPSEAMSSTMSRLGITLEDFKDPAIGMSGVMKMIAEDTDGSTVALQALFPDVRSLRGALALTANEGKTYARVMESQADAAGAAGEAFKIQMESVQAQWSMFKNRVGATAIAGLLKVLPLVQDAGAAVGDTFAAIGERVYPAWVDLQNAGADLVDIIRALWAGIQPVAAAVATMFGGAVLGAVSAFAALLSWVTSLVSEYGGALKVVGGILASVFVASKIMGVAQSIQIMTANLKSIAAFRGISATSLALERLGVGANGAIGGVNQLKVSLGGLAATAAPAAVIMGITAAIDGMANATKKAKEQTEAIDAKAAGKGLEGLRQAYNEAAAATRNLDGTVNSGQSTWGRLGRSFQSAGQLLTPFKNTVADSTAALKEQNKHAGELGGRLATMSTHYNRLGYNLGISRQAVEKLVLADEDLNLTTATTAEVTASVTASLDALSSSSGVSEEKIGSLLETMSPEELEEFTEEMNKAAAAVSDTVRQFGSLTSIQGLQFNDDLTLTASQLTWNLAAIESFYKRRLEGARQFSADMTAAIADGYDPAVIMELASAGPEAAGPILRTLVAGYSDEMVELVNSASREIENLAATTAEKARAMYMATTLGTDELTKQLPDYQQAIDMAAAGIDPPVIAMRLGMKADEFNQLMNDFGNTTLKVQQQVDRNGVKVPVSVKTEEFDDSVKDINLALHKFTTGRYSAEVVADTVDAAQDIRVLDEEFDHLTRRRTSQVDADATPAELAETDDALEAVAKLREAHIKGVPVDEDLVETIFGEVARTRPALMQALMQNGDWVERSLTWISRDRPSDIKAEAKNTGKARSDIDGVANKSRTAHIAVRPETSGFMGLIAALRSEVEQQQWRVRVTASTYASHPALGGAYGRYGGFHAFATGGVRPLGTGGVTRTPIVAFGERETGGEAFIPRLGISDTRAKEILDVAAGWHGMTVLPTAQTRNGGGGGTIVQMGDITVTTAPGVDGRQIGAQVAAAVKEQIPAITKAVARSRGQAKAVTGR